jgi:hypothetical protein
MDATITERTKECIGGGLMVVLGAGAIVLGVTYHVGTLREMGPGFFPVLLGVLLVLTGLAIIVVGFLSANANALKTIHFDARVWTLIVASLIAFVVLGTHGGLLAAAFAVTFISALADRDNTIKSAAILAVAICVVAAVVFSWALQMQMPLYTWD